MGACVEIPGKPPPVEIQLPGGAKAASMASGTQQVPNLMDPFQTVLSGAAPALGAIKPVFDVIGFVMAGMECFFLILKIMGSLMGMFAPGNPFSEMFKLDPMIDPNTDEPILLIPEIEVLGVVIFEGGPEIPDFPAVAPLFIECILKVICFAMKLAALETHLSSAATIKDGVMTAMGFADAAMAQLNSLTDLFSGIPAADSGLPEIDIQLQCAADGSSIQLEHKLGPVGNLVPLMSILSLIADIAKQPLPAPIVQVAILLANTADGDPPGFGVIPFPDLSDVGGPTSDEQRETFVGLLEEMAISGLPIEIPDFSDLSALGDVLNDMQEQMEPLLPVIELLQSVIDKLTKC
jgi:hypothetical protein